MLRPMEASYRLVLGARQYDIDFERFDSRTDVTVFVGGKLQERIACRSVDDVNSVALMVVQIAYPHFTIPVVAIGQLTSDEWQFFLDVSIALRDFVSCV